jgi:hypothetical protein
MRLLWSFLVLCASAWAINPPFVISTIGVSQIHATQMEDDANYVALPLSNVGYIWQDPNLGSAAPDLGCSGNGTYIACDSHTGQPGFAVYQSDARGNISEIYNSGAGPGKPAATTCIPIIAATADNGGDSSVIVADYEYIYRYAIDGTQMWKTALPYGPAGDGTGIFGINSVRVTAAGVAVVIPVSNAGATAWGPLAAFNARTGALITNPGPVNYIYPGGTSDATTYGAKKSACVVDNWPTTGTSTMYYVGDLVGSASDARMYAIQINPTTGLSAAYYHAISGPTNTSTMCHPNPNGGYDIVSDTCAGCAPGTAGQIVLTDSSGTGFTEKFAIAGLNTVDANGAYYPTGNCFVYWQADLTTLTCGSMTDGSPVFSYDLGSVVPGESNTTYPASDDSMYYDGSHYYLIITLRATVVGGGCYIVCVRMTDGTLMWTYTVSKIAGETAAHTGGQYPMLTAPNGAQRFMFTSSLGGPTAIGPPDGSFHF